MQMNGLIIPYDNSEMIHFVWVFAAYQYSVA